MAGGNVDALEVLGAEEDLQVVSSLVLNDISVLVIHQHPRHAGLARRQRRRLLPVGLDQLVALVAVDAGLQLRPVEVHLLGTVLADVVRVVEVGRRKVALDESNR